MKQLVLTLILILYLAPLLFSQTSQTYLDSGYKNLTQGNDTGAITDFTKAIELNPNFVEAYVWRAAAKERLGDTRGAIQDCNKAIELNPNSARAYFLRGLSKLNLGQKDSGCLDLSKAGELGYAEAYETIRQSCN